MRILRGLTGRMLSCGCVIGAYETYQGTVVWILDERVRPAPTPRTSPASPSMTCRNRSVPPSGPHFGRAA